MVSLLNLTLSKSNQVSTCAGVSARTFQAPNAGITYVSHKYRFSST